MVRQNKYITVLEAEDDYGNSGFVFDCSLDEMIEQLVKIRESVPKEFRTCTRIEFEAGSYYDSSYATVKISYTRPETIEEETAREQHAQHQALMVLASRRAEYERLKREFGDV